MEYEEKSGLVLPWQDMINKVGEEYHAMRTRLIAIAPEHGPRLRSLATTSSDAEFVTALQDIIHEAMEELSLDHSEQGDNAWQQFTRALVQKRADVKPPEPLSLSEWANKYAVLSRENAAQTGRFRSFKYQDGMMDAITDPTVTQVSVMKSARVGYTKILDHVVGYYLSHDPSPILVVQPRVEDAEDYSKGEIAPCYVIRLY
ncbi:phage terminase large subunit family protein [Providencia rettgeri]|nr:phage terminase large subunit family protein [Providencia rettgeri]